MNIRNNKRGASFLIPLLLIVGLLFAGGYLSFASLYSSVYKANWGSIECVQHNDYDVKYSRWLDQATVFKCDDYTNECKFSLEQSPPLNLAQRLLLSTSYQICYLGGQSCSSSVVIPTLQSGEYRTLVTIPVGREIRFSSNYGSNIRVIKEVKSFYIQGRENGKIFVQESCKLNADLLSRVLGYSNGAIKGGLTELSFSGANQYQNYLIDFVSVASQIYQYQGQEVICQARQLSKVETLPFLDNTPKKIQGNIITSVDCCPSEANCDPSTFKFSANSPSKECSFNTECPNSGNPVATSGTSYVSYQCIQGTCQKSSEVAVECTNTATCINKHGANSVCDLSQNNFGKCITNTKPNYCGDNLCNSIDGENAQTCPADCVQGYLQKSWSWWIWALIAVGFLVVYKYIKPSLRHLPLIGKFFP